MTYSASDIFLGLKQHLQLITDLRRRNPVPKDLAYAGTEDFLLQNGEECEIRLDHKDKGPIKNCYGNCHNFVLANPDWTYYEGLAFSGLLPTLHAWVRDPDGVFLDLTWKPYEDRELVYGIGVGFNLKFINETVLRTEVYGILNPECGSHEWMMKDTQREKWAV